MAKDLIPSVTFRGKQSLINRTASALLLQNGAQYIAVTVSKGKVIMKPLEIDGLLKIAKVVRLDQNRGICSLDDVVESLGITTPQRFSATWNDVDERLEVDLSAPMKSRRRANATA